MAGIGARSRGATRYSDLRGSLAEELFERCSHDRSLGARRQFRSKIKPEVRSSSGRAGGRVSLAVNRPRRAAETILDNFFRGNLGSLDAVAQALNILVRIRLQPAPQRPQRLHDVHPNRASDAKS